MADCWHWPPPTSMSSSRLTAISQGCLMPIMQRPGDSARLTRARQRAVREAGIAKRAACHALPHLVRTQLLEDGYDIRTLQELLGHTDASTTMIYTAVLNRGGLGCGAVRTRSEARSRFCGVSCGVGRRRGRIFCK